MSHTTTIKVRFADLDPYDHVNHARYFTYFESARIELLDEIGFGMTKMRDTGYRLVLTDLQARFHLPAGLGDVLTITTDVIETRRVSARWRQEARRGEDLLVSLEVGAAFVGVDGRPRRMPPGFAEVMERFTIPGLHA